jgi:hypothetical protein
VLKNGTNILYKPYKEYRNRHTPDPTPPGSDTRSVASHNGQGSDSGSTDATVKKNVAGRMVMASGKSIGDFGIKGFKAATVDIPVAAAEGLWNVPSLYGDKPRDHGRVTDWKSGAVVGGKVSGHWVRRAT